MNILSQSLDHKSHWDKAGIGASFLCVLHCLITPFLITALPALEATEHQTHSALAIAMLIIGTLAFAPGYVKHRRLMIPTIALLGLTLIIAAVMLPEQAGIEPVEKLMVIVGGVTLIAAHLRNAYWCRFCRQCCEGSCALQGTGEVTSPGYAE